MFIKTSTATGSGREALAGLVWGEGAGDRAGSVVVESAVH